MITIFNRKELIITFDLEKQAKIRSLLVANNIKYLVKVVNRSSPSPCAAGTRSRMGNFGENLSHEYEYKIYVHKNDYSEAASIVKRGVWILVCVLNYWIET